jgi:succinate-semialdehyde dehydrogenase/glutarate-semialdehyde dehydrogenase
MSTVKTLTSLNPATGDIVGTVPVTPVNDVDKLVDAARAAQPAWAALTLDERAEMLRAGAAKMLERAQEIAETMSLEMGKPVKEALGEVKSCCDLDKEIEEVREAIEPEVKEHKGVRSTLYRDPHGVVASITPWNFPVSMPHWMILPALATGNAVVFKPSEETPLCGQMYAECMMEALPPGVLQVMHGAEAQGKALVASRVDMIAFTGSREAGKAILGAAAKDLKRVILELGGKDPLVVLEGADLEEAAKFAARNSFRNAGQVCVSTERIFVEESVHDAFVDALKAASTSYAEGDRKIGPMVNKRQRSHVLKQVDAAIASGAQVALGHERHEGNYVEPTILLEVGDDMDIARDETFGPVACVSRVKDADEAIARANDTVFGLGAVLFGPPGEASRAAARKLTAGMIGVNRSIGGAPGTPWVGARESGYGFHSGVEGHRHFTQLRVVSEAI